MRNKNEVISFREQLAITDKTLAAKNAKNAKRADTQAERLAKKKKKARQRTENLPILKELIKIKVEGFNQARILNTLKKEKIALQNIEMLSPKQLQLTIAKKDGKKTFAILQNMCYDYSVVAESGKRNFAASCLKHIGIIAGVLVFASLLALASQMVWRIEIEGNQTLESKLILRSLNQSGVKIGTFKSKVDTDALTKALREMDGIAETTVQLVGTRVVVSVIEEKRFVPPDSNGSSGNNDSGNAGGVGGTGENGEPTAAMIVSRFDAEITRINIKSGTTTVRVGDKVAAGAELIRGERLSSAGEHIEFVAPKGSVFGKVAFSEKHIFSTTEQILMRSGKKKTFNTLSLFGLKIGKKKPPTGWECEVTSAKTTLLPIKITQYACYETKLVERERDIEGFAEQLKAQALLNNVIKAGGSEIETVTTLTPVDGGLMMLNIYIVAEVQLA